MIRRAELLPESLLWADQGHLSDEALCAYADGQTSLLPATALVHAENCDDCSARLGTLALASWELAGALREATSFAEAPAPLREVASLAEAPAPLREVASLAEAPAAAPALRPSTPSPVPASVRRPLPWQALAAALVLTALTSLPSAGLVLQWLRTAWAVWPRVLPQLPALGHTLRALVASALGPLGLAMPLLTSLILLLSGCAVASAALKIRSQKGTILS
ncbi:MAG: hypothetical protein MUF34_30850 [Polyangiaceae bacterium]|jgi:hypothetical protein|nr:hypothetical protein [Polyangiaceae bacterium]